MAVPLNQVDTSSFTPEQLQKFNSAAALAPVAQSNPSPAPQMTSPAAQGAASPMYNANAAPGTAGSLAPTATQPTQQTQPAQATQTPTTQAPTQNLQPGSQGQDVLQLQNYLASLGYLSSAQISTGPGIYGPQTQAAIAKLQNDLGVNAGANAGFYGPQTQAALAQKYKGAFANASGAAPTNGAQAQSAMDAYTAQIGDQTDQQQAYFEKLFGMNPVESTIFSQLTSLLSTQTTQQSLTDFYKQELAAQGLPELNTQLADINNVMRGTEDDIRKEISSSGGIATDSQVQALTGARNKVLLNQAQYLSDLITSKNDYVDKIVQLTGEDRKAISDDMDRKLGISKTLFDMSQSMETATRSNIQSIVDSIGWDGLAASVKDSPEQAASIEKAFGMSPGELQSIASYQSPAEQESLLRLQNLNLQNKKLAADLASGPDISSQVVNMGTSTNPHYKLINTKTGATIADYGTTAPTGGGPQALAVQQQNIQDIGSLLQNSAIAAVVKKGVTGYYPGGTPSLAIATGAASNYIAGVEQLRQQLTLDNLQNAKANGATFGALSDSELNLLSQSASKLGTWAIKDKAGNVTGYNIDQKDFKAELDKINNFQKLDFVLKGGDPASVGIVEQADGSLWSKNSDGTYTKIK